MLPHRQHLCFEQCCGCGQEKMQAGFCETYLTCLLAAADLHEQDPPETSCRLHKKALLKGQHKLGCAVYGAHLPSQ